MSDHAKLSPSARHRWGFCPGSVREEAKYPEEAPGKAAIEGTHSHTLLEHCIKTRLKDPLELVGSEMTDHDGWFKVTQDQALRVKVAIDYIKRRVAEETVPGFTPEVISEEKVDPSFLLRRDDCHGTVDVQIWGKVIYEIADYKDGMNPVPVFANGELNPQLEQYALGVLSRFKLGPLEPYPFGTVRLTIIQPRLALKGMDPITSYDVPLADLLRNMHKIQEQAALTDDPNAPLVPGDSQCKYCRARGACVALAQKSMEGVGLMFQPVNQPPAFLAGIAAPVQAPPQFSPVDLAHQSVQKDPNQMTGEDIQRVLEAAPLLRQFIAAVEEEAERRLLAGQPVPGFKMVRGPGSRSWKLPEEEMVKVLTTMGVPKGNVYKTTLVSPAQVEKLVWTKKTKGEETKGQLSDKQIKKLETEYIVKSQGKLTLAPESDSRESAIADATGMFTAIPAAPEPAITVVSQTDVQVQEIPLVPTSPAFEMPAWMR